MEEKISRYLEVRNCGTPSPELKSKYLKKIAKINDTQEFTEKLEIFKALSNKERFLIYKLLIHEPLCTCFLSFLLDKTESTINRNLKILEKAGLIFGKKEGYFVFYYTRENFLDEFVNDSHPSLSTISLK